VELSESVEFPGDSFYAAAENSMRSETTYPNMNPRTALFMVSEWDECVN